MSTLPKMTSNQKATLAAPTQESASEPASETNKELAERLEKHDKEGKKLYKEQKYTEAAAAFTAAIEACGTDPKYQKQLVILLNNRSAMYEKAGLLDLALEDCGTVLELDAKHAKARNKRARIFEGQGKWKEALTEYCAVQLDFMHSNKEKLIRGIPLDPPVDQAKMEELCDKCVPEAMTEAEARREKYLGEQKKTGGHLKLPTKHTVGMLLESFTSCEGWKADAADDKTVGELSVELAADLEPADKCDLLFKRGRRSAFDTNYDEAYADFRQAMKILDEKSDVKDEMRYYCDLLEWDGVCKHLSYDMSGATVAYEKALEACDDSNGAKKCELMVRCAGIKMDEGEIPTAEKWFEKALALDPNFPDALLHRSNLYMLQRNLEKATADIEKCLQLKPDFLSAQLRQATLFMHSNDAQKALKCLDVADKLSPKSSDIQIYRGELFFTMSDVDKALECFEKAMDYDKSNPNAYVNAALAIMNKQPAMGQPPDIPRAMTLLEKGLEIDPQFQGAYIHLGQLKLTMAKELSDCVEVIDLYTQGLNQCRTKDEMADLVKMQIMAEAQHEAAMLLKMVTLS
ncbi:hypothetical protein TrLO_g676 [Triparma laevis f. longispina]|uniref:Mitochondrial import receptor subunit TOM70 n=1 Tax=Triparma laevis f. longispina TaxID=1714387 RepID=A0A9W7FQU0_9STRA|nr:hypothetical protein TrLO_g676 [Triparma laevis f. longispina]